MKGYTISITQFGMYIVWFLGAIVGFLIGIKQPGLALFIAAAWWGYYLLSLWLSMRRIERQFKELYHNE